MYFYISTKNQFHYETYFITIFRFEFRYILKILKNLNFMDYSNAISNLLIYLPRYFFGQVTVN